jgi:uncharacterized protein (DUF1800 family)
VAHLHRRAGFSASWSELQRDLAEGAEASINRLVDGKARGVTEGASEEFEATSALLAESALASNEPARLTAWWFYRVLYTPDPIGERLTLLWHDHFATSNSKVDNLSAMHRQNQTFRRFARAPFGVLLNEVIRDPALLLWLDAPSNRKGQPNENLARELLELFTLGIGNYTERDVKETARALTGWTVAGERFANDNSRHDDGEKSILGSKGRWSGSDLLRILLEHPATAMRLARRICRLLMGEGAVEENEVADLAAELRRNELDVGRAVATVIRSRAFFAERNIRSRILDPVGFVAGPVRALGLWDRPPSTLALADWSARLGQDLFYPPNVGGWPGGRSWLTSRTIIARANYAGALVTGSIVGRPEPLDPLDLAGRAGCGDDRESVLRFFATILTGASPSVRSLARWVEAAGPRSSWGPDTARRAVALILASPSAQLA